jgi:hypothetical protein
MRQQLWRLTAVGLVALCMPEVPVEKRENDELD